MAHTALVTGGNRGIGLETCRQLAGAGFGVVLTARRREDAEAAALTLQASGLDVRAEALDVAGPDAATQCAQRLRNAGVIVDVLVNNAGVYPTEPLLGPDEGLLLGTLEVNLLGALRVCRAFMPEMVAQGYGRVVNVSSGLGSFAHGIRPGAYGVSKAALNALTCALASEVLGNVKVNATDPGWVATRMGGRGAPRSVEVAAQGIVWLATLPEDGPNGGFFRDQHAIPW